MNGGREKGDAICKICGEWYWFSPGVRGRIHCFQEAVDSVIEKHKEALRALADHEKQDYPADDGRTYSEAEPDEP